MSVEELRERFYSSFSRQVEEVARAKKFVKVALVLGGAFIAAVCAFVGGSGLWSLSPTQTTGWQIGGIAGAVAAFLGGWFFAVVEGNSTAQELEEARQAIDHAVDEGRYKAEIIDELDAYENARVRLTSLYYAYSLARGAIEQALDRGIQKEIDLI